MKFVVLAILLAACGGKFADDEDGGPIDASVKDVVPKKDGAPVVDTSIDIKPPPPPLDAGVNVSGNGPGYESEDEIAVAPDGTIAVLWQAFTPQSPPYIAMKYSFSTNDGQTFTTPADVITPNGLYPGDPAITVDAQGNFWASYLGIAYSGSTVAYSRVYVAEAPKGTLKFGQPVEISQPNNTTDLIDHPKIHVTSAGSLLVGWADIAGPDFATGIGVVARSTNGTTWTRTTVAQQPETPFANFFWFCESSAGIHTTFLEATNAYVISLRTSTDDGISFGTGPSTQVSLDADEVAGLDPMCAGNGNDVWVMYTTTQNPSVDETTLDGADHIWIAHSTNGGQTFPTRSESLDTGSTKLATIPLLVRDAVGMLDVAYVAGDFDQDTSGSIRLTRSGGPSKVIDGPMLFDLSRTSETWVGDYFGGVAQSGNLYLAYPRNETGLDHIYFAKVAVP
jgi:hypothetical protein